LLYERQFDFVDVARECIAASGKKNSCGEAGSMQAPILFSPLER
jgi:hypothetical protein